MRLLLNLLAQVLLVGLSVAGELLCAALLTAVALWRFTRAFWLHFFWPAERQTPPWYHLDNETTV